MFEVQELSLHGAFLIRGPGSKDQRGAFQKTVHKEFFEQHGLEWSFAEQFYSTSNKNVIRGMHYQIPPHDHVKLIYCVSGEATDVLMDLRAKSPTYGKCIDVRLSGGDGKIIYIPKGLAHGFLATADNTILMYSVGSIHEPAADQGIHWQSIPYDWKNENPIVSARDQALVYCSTIETPRKFYLL
jgi:dTDP-4-dehydrorhamnose 3,5-epimerase